MPTLFRFTMVLSAFLMGSKTSIAQDVITVDYLLGLKPKPVQKYELPKTSSSSVVLPFGFASDTSSTLKLIDSLLNTSRPIVQIDFVYTRFKLVEDFDQRALNKKRIEKLRSSVPLIFDNNTIEWKFVEQVNNYDLEHNKTLFHGFVFHFLEDSFYEGNDGKLSTEEEIDLIKAYLEEIYIEREERIPGSITPGPRVFYPMLKKKREKGIVYERKFLFWRKSELLPDDTTWTTRRIPGYYRPFIDDSVVTKNFRKYCDHWDSVVVIQDVTGSMYPYIAQTLAWKKLYLDSTNLKDFVFFNDGDSRPDGPLGKSGGAYHIHSNDYSEIDQLIYKTMRKGYGGMAPENNVEATTFAASKKSDATEFILIADNNAPVRDLKNVAKIDKPTHIILCGVRSGRIHHSYIKLAMETGGSLHTIEEDILSVDELVPGDTFKIAGQIFKYIGPGHIVLIGESE